MYFFRDDGKQICEYIWSIPRVKFVRFGELSNYHDCSRMLVKTGS